MSSTVVSLTASNATDAVFRAWAKAVSDAILAVGLTRTADTGQINWTTVTHPTVALTAQGYEIFQLTDSLQASKPVYVKVEYGSGAQTGGAAPGLWVTVGTATDGAGTITSSSTLPGSTTTRQQLSPANSSDTTSGGTGPLIVSGDASSVVVHLFGQVSGSTTWGGAGFLLERSRDADGSAAGRGVTLWTWSNGSNSGGAMNARCITLDPAYTQPAGISTGYTVYVGGLPTSVVEGSTVYPLPVFTGASPRLNAPSKFLTLAGRTDIPLGSQYPMTHYGVSGTWISCGPGASGSTAGYGNWTAVNANISSMQIKL